MTKTPPVIKPNGDYALLVFRLDQQDRESKEFRQATESKLKDIHGTLENLNRPRPTNWQALSFAGSIVFFLFGITCSVIGLYFNYRLNQEKSEREKVVAVLENRIATMYSEAKRQEKYLSMVVQKELGIKPEKEIQ